MKPPHLTTIIPEAAISRWYHYAYSGGIRYFLNNENPTDEGIDTPLGFDFGFAIRPPPWPRTANVTLFTQIFGEVRVVLWSTVDRT